MKSKFLDDFKAFATRGNAMDMAIGVIMGAAFGKIVTSLVNDIIMPIIGKLVGGIDLTSLKLVISPESTDSAGKVIPEVALGYGMFLQNTINFLIIAFSIFLFITLIGKVMRKKEAAATATPPPPAPEVTLLTEIRDLLKEEKK